MVSRYHYLIAILLDLLLFASAPVWVNPVLALPVQGQTEADRKTEAGRLYQEATEQLRQGQSREALKTFEEVLALVRKIQERQGEGATLNQIGSVYYNLGDLQKALDYYQQALAIFKERGTDGLNHQGHSLNNIAAVYQYLGQYQKALDYYQQALIVRRQVADRGGEGTTLNNIAAVYDSLGQYNKALDFYRQALDIFTKTSNLRGKAVTLNNIGLTYSNQGQYQQSLPFYEEALALFRTEVDDPITKGRTLTLLGSAHSQLDRYPEALAFLEEALSVRRQSFDRPGEAVTLDRMGTVYQRQGEYQKALAFYEQALAISREVDYRLGMGDTLSNMGETLFKTNQFAAATEHLTTAIEVWESLRPGLTDENKVSLFDRQTDTYRKLQEALIAHNNIDGALEVAERGRARAFVELLASRLGSVRAIAFQSVKPPSVEQIKKIAAQQKATLVEYSLVGNQLYIWVISPQGKVDFRQTETTLFGNSVTEVAQKTLLAAATGRSRGGESNQTVNDLVQETRQQTQMERGSGEFVRINRRLYQSYQLLIEPIADLLPKNPNDRVLFIPQGALFLIPFAALQDSQGTYLIQKHTIAIAPSIQVLDLTHQHRQRLQQQSARDALVVGNPTMPSLAGTPDETPRPLYSLPGAQQEAIAIAKLLKTQPIMGPEATETAIVQRMPTARIVHLATHGLLNEYKHQGLGVPGAIALAPGNGEDGLLTSGEILNLKLNAELVVLSACNTGLGKITGDGVLGLSRSFISAGVPSMVVSLWAIPDAPTAELMTEFYRQLQRHSNKAVALRQAMLTLMRDRPQPSEWAAFTLIGEAE